MKKNLFLLLLACSMVVSCMSQERMTLTRFGGKKITGIDAGGAWEVKLTQGQATKAVLTFPKRLEKQLVLSLDKDGTLNIGFRGKIRTEKNETFIAEIVCSSLKKLDLSGACQLEGVGKFTGSKMEFDLSGASKVTFGENSLSMNDWEIDMSGASKLIAGAAVSNCDIEMSGASSLMLSGKAQYVKYDASGASKSDLSSFEMQNMDIGVSGASKVNVKVTGRIRGKVSGASKVIYTGGATCEVDVSGASTFRHN